MKLHNSKLLTFACETLGGLGKEAQHIISWIMRRYDEARATAPRGEILRRLKYSTCCTVMRGTYRLYESWLRDVRPHMPPMPVAVSGAASA